MLKFVYLEFDTIFICFLCTHVFVVRSVYYVCIIYLEQSQIMNK